MEKEEKETIPSKIANAAEEACAELLPGKSKNHYDSTYRKFVEWKNQESIKISNESVLLAYYNKLSKLYAPSSMWTFFSMLKSTIMLYENVDIQKYSRLQHLLKANCKNYEGKKSKVFTAGETENFLTNAPDDAYLATKVATICGVWGACRGDELTKMKIHHIKEQGELLLVDVPDTKTKKARRFIIGEDYAPTVKKYKALRPKYTTTDRFFINYKNGKCTPQPIGKHKFAAMPQQIARYLNIADAENYTGHAFRRTSATLLADSGTDITTLKRHGGWKSTTVTEGYIEESNENKTRISKLISSTVTQPNILNPTIQNSINKTNKIRHVKNETKKRPGIMDDIGTDIPTPKVEKSTGITFNNCSVTIQYHTNQ